MLKQLFSFNGRLRRIHYILYILFGGFVSSLFFLIVAVGLAALLDSYVVPIVLCIPYSILYIWFCLAVAIKRIHDINKSGWFYLLFLIPIVNFVWALMLLFMDGTVGPNKYGKDPKNRMPMQQAQTGI